MRVALWPLEPSEVKFGHDHADTRGKSEEAAILPADRGPIAGRSPTANSQ